MESTLDYPPVAQPFPAAGRTGREGSVWPEVVRGGGGESHERRWRLDTVTVGITEKR